MGIEIVNMLMSDLAPRKILIFQIFIKNSMTQTKIRYVYLTHLNSCLKELQKPPGNLVSMLKCVGIKIKLKVARKMKKNYKN